VVIEAPVPVEPRLPVERFAALDPADPLDPLDPLLDPLECEEDGVGFGVAFVTLRG
jgi:hypothetical protein